MKSAKFIILFFGLSIILNSCGTLEEAGKVLRNDKRSTDEFLIKKKGPLTQPPDFDKIPEPGSNKNQAGSEVSNIERILKKILLNLIAVKLNLQQQKNLFLIRLKNEPGYIFKK